MANDKTTLALRQAASCFEAIAGANQRPGHVAYLNKADMCAIAERGLAIVAVALAEQVSA